MILSEGADINLFEENEGRLLLITRLNGNDSTVLLFLAMEQTLIHVHLTESILSVKLVKADTIALCDCYSVKMHILIYVTNVEPVLSLLLVKTDMIAHKTFYLVKGQMSIVSNISGNRNQSLFDSMSKRR